MVCKKMEINKKEKEMKDLKLKLFIPKKIIERKDISPYEIGVYCALKALAHQNEYFDYDSMYVNLDLIAFVLFKTANVSPCIRNELSIAFNSLVSKKVINCFEKNKTCSILSVGQFRTDTNSDYFVIVYWDEIVKITTSENKIKMRLLKYFLNLLGTIDVSLTVTYNGCTKTNVIGNLSQEYISKIANVSVSSVPKYNRCLERLKLIYIYRSSNIVLTDKGFGQPVNVYGRYRDKVFINTFAAESELVSVQERTEKLYASDNGRRLAQMYTWLCRGKQYSEPEITEIYKYILSHNEKIQRLYEQRGNEDCLKELKDTSIFKQFDFLITELS